MNTEEFKLTRKRLQRENGEFFNSIYNLIQHAEAVEQKAQKQYDEGYQKGLEDAWEMIWMIVTSKDAGGMSREELRNCFGTDMYTEICRMTVSEVKAKYDAWKAEKELDDEIRVGDVVTSPSAREYIVLHISYDDGGIKTFTVLEVSTGFVLHFKECFLEKTGKHYDLPWLQETENDS